MLDYAPELEQSKVLLQNLFFFCSISRDKTLNEIERDWSDKLLERIRFQNNERNQTLSVRLKDILAPLNKDFNYEYCFGNQGIVDTLKDLNKHRFNQLQSIRHLTDHGSAVSVVKAIQTIRSRAEEEAETRLQQNDRQAKLRQEQENREPETGKEYQPRNRLRYDNEVDNGQLPPEVDDIFDSGCGVVWQEECL